MGNETNDLYQVNLSDFALFLSVMKNKKAYRNVLSIILNEPEVQMEQVKVEEVILNEKGKRAIRLDAWGKTTDRRHFNIEMQNDTEHDDTGKRSRYYQALMDTPILKAGKKTKYRQLPPSIVIFITQEDFLGRDLAMYCFEETCLELPDLKLNDGTQKIFLNMTSKNGREELISLLQYMKCTRLDNPEIRVRDGRMKELDRIVSEVKTSEEWEEVHMSILSVGMERGEEIGRQRGEKIGKEIGKELGKEIGKEQNLIELVCRKLAKNKSPEEIAEVLEEQPERINAICVAAAKYAPEYDIEKIYKELHKV